MNKAIAAFISVFAFIGGFVVFYNLVPLSNPVQINPNVTDSPQMWESKIDEQASVTITATPSDLGIKSKEWKFNIVMSTHSVELSQDMTKVVMLYDDAGKEYSPVRWEGSPAGGHHREGVLTFNKIIPPPQSIELRISSIGGVVRRYVWQLE